MSSRFALCDVFADAPLCGNQLAVFLDGETLDDQTMAAFAREFGWSEVTLDAATGSAAGPLGAYLVYYGLHRAGAMDIEQGIEMGRPSRISVTVPQEGGEIGPVQVAGNVRIWGRGTLQEPASSMLEP